MKLQTGEYGSINILELIYLPLYGSKSGKSTPELLDIAIKLTPQIAKADRQKQSKLQDLLILLTSTFVSKDELRKIWEVNMLRLEDNPAVIMLEKRGEKRKALEIAINLLRKGYNINDVSEVTGLSISRLSDLQIGLQAMTN